MRALRLLLLAVLLLGSCTAAPGQLNQRGNRAYIHQNYDAALRAYLLAQAAQPDSAEPGYNAANTLYRQGDLLAARQRMLAAVALLEAGSPPANTSLLQNTYYNLGNIEFRMGDYASAVQRYRAALRLDPADADAKHNLELALRRLPQSVRELPTPDEPATHQAAETEPAPPRSGTQSPASTAKPTSAGTAPTLNPEQARRLLDMANDAARLLQPSLQQTPSAGVRPPAQDW